MPDRVSNRMPGSVIFAIAIILMLVSGWHMLFPVLPVALTMTATIWGVVVATITLLCITIVLFLVFTGLGVVLLGCFAFTWAMLAIGFFPVIFPLLAPLLVILLFIVVWRRQKNRHKRT